MDMSLEPRRMAAAFGVALSLLGACSKRIEGPEPTLSAAGPVAPAIVCKAQRTSELTLTGRGLSPVPIDVPNHPAIAVPSVSFTRAHELDGATADGESVLFGGDPTAPRNLALLRWDSQQQMRVTIHQSIERSGGVGELAPGIYDLLVQNPNRNQVGAGAALAVVDKPVLNAITPALLCLEQGSREFTLNGTTLLNIDGELPRVRIEGASDPFSSSALDKCTRIAYDAREASYCDEARVTVASGAVPEGLHDVQLENPEPAACHSEEQLQLRVVRAPIIDAVEPEALCNLDDSANIVIRGQGFLQVNDLLPEVSMAGRQVPVSMLESCEDLPTTGLQVKRCERIVLALDATQFALGDVAVEVRNSDPAGCAGTAQGKLRVVGRPSIAAIAPSELCSDVASVFTVMGSGFDRGARASIDGADAAVEFVSENELRVTSQALAVGTHAFTVRNAGSCEATKPAALTVEPSPIVFFVDPPRVYNATPVDITIFTSGLAGNAIKVELVRDQERRDLTNFRHAAANKLVARVDAGLASGDWDVVVTSGAGCPGILPGGLVAGDSLSDALVTAIEPRFAYVGDDTAITLSGAGLMPVPRVYLTPVGGSGSAQALRAVEVKSGGGSLTAIIPAGFSAGKYDLIAVNPDGKVDVLAQAVTITANKPPVITTVTPASLPANATASLTLAGSDFRSNLTVELDCKQPDGTRVPIATTEQAPTNGGKNVVVDVSISSAVAAGSVCLVRLTNEDSAYFEYSAFSITNSSFNLSSWRSAPALKTARRALSLVAGRPTATSRYIYAIGGDNGVDNDPNTRGSSVFDAIESSQVDVFGAMSEWAPQRNTLPGPRSGAGAVTVGRFVYLVGGHDGSNVHDELYRAAILDPLAGPTIEDLDASLGNGQLGLSQGLYYYRVASVAAAGDLANPGGEGLAGELLPVQMPERSEKIVLTLKWSAVAGANRYRIYRSPSPSATADSLQRIGEIDCGASLCDCVAHPEQCSFRDDGKAADASKTPLPAGSLGVWHAVNGARCSTANCSLASAREGFAVTALANPADTNQWFLYTFGGRGAGGTYLDSYEVATITLSAGGAAQTVADWVPGNDTLSLPRADHGAWLITKQNSQVIAGSGSPNDVWIYVGGGRTTGGSTDTSLEAGKLGSNGQLDAFVASDPLKGALVGFATGASNDQLYTFGGIAGNADGTSAHLCDGSGSCTPLPDLKSGAFNALGSATTNRMYGSATQESAFFFVAGGHDGQHAITGTQTTVQ